MSKYRKKPVEFEAVQWLSGSTDKVQPYTGPYIAGTACLTCSHLYPDHGWITTTDPFDGGLIVCPGDWVLTSPSGHNYPCHPEFFNNTFEPVP